jgi:hypothetical protein
VEAPGPSPLPRCYNNSRKNEFHEVAQTDLAGAIEALGSHLVIAAVQHRDRELSDLLAAPDAVGRRNRGEQCRSQGGLARSGLARDCDPAAELHHGPQEIGGLRSQRVAGNEGVE